MAGNVWEWTSSLVGGTTAQLPCIDILPNQMPVIKGGAFNWDVDALRCGAHYWFNPSQRHNLLGFRLVWTAAPTEA
jgi:formylglycine-generating enzyme required for sulfatase activity